MQQNQTGPKMRSRVIAAAASTALVAGVGGLVVAGAPAANAATVTKSYPYTCHVVAAGLDLGNKAVGVKASVALPNKVAPGQTITKRSTSITLTIGEELRAATYGLLGARKAGGYSKDAAVTLAAPGMSTKKLNIANLSSPPVVVPPNEGDKWNIPTKGTVPAVKVPVNAKRAATIAMPARFTVKATLYNEAGDKIGGDDAVNMDCKTTANRTLAKVTIAKASSKIAKAKVAPKKIKAKKTKAKIAVKVNSPGVKATGKITAKVGKKTVGTAKVKNGKATIKLKKFKKKGTYKVKLTYSGSKSSKAAKKTVKVKVRK